MQNPLKLVTREYDVVKVVENQCFINFQVVTVYLYIQ